MTVVTLDPEEVFVAAHTGVLRRYRRMSNGWRSKTKLDPALDYWAAEIEGACAEFAVSKQTDTHWRACPTAPGKLSDSGEFHVRHTPHETGHLILYRDDPDAVFVLVTGRAPTFTIRGAIHASDGRDRRFWRTNCYVPAYWIPQSALVSLDRFLLGMDIDW